MKHIFYCFLITAIVQFRACYPADETTSNFMSMAAFANKSESAMESMTSSKNTTQTFTSSKSNLLLEAAKTLDITNIKSDEEFLRLLFESAFNIIIDTKLEESLFFSDLTTIVPSIMEKVTNQLQAAFFNVFFGGIVNAGVTTADMGVKIAAALEAGKLSAASQGIETAENIADIVVSNVPSNGLTNEVKRLVNVSLDGADGAIKAAKNLETEGSNIISNVLNRFKTADASTNPVDISSQIANTLETAKLTASEGVQNAQKIADKIPGSLPSKGVTDEAKKIVSTSLEGANGATEAVKTLETAVSNAVGGVLNTFKFGK